MDQLLHLNDDDEEMEEIAAAAAPPLLPPPLPPNLAAPPPAPAVNFKLQPFWADAAVAWFAAAEVQFTLRRIVSQQDRFCLVAAALDKDTLKKVIHLVTTPHPVTPYTQLKEALLVSHQLTDFQRVELLLAMPPLGGRKPSVMLADMLELCPPGQADNIFFVGLFLQRLPRELRVLLTHEDHTDLRRLAAHADRLLAFNTAQPHEIAAVAAVEDLEGSVAAIKQQKGKPKQKPPPLPPRGGNRQGTGGAGGKQGQQAVDPAPAKLAQQASGLCFFHWRYGSSARDCRQPCSWAAEN